MMLNPSSQYAVKIVTMKHSINQYRSSFRASHDHKTYKYEFCTPTSKSELFFLSKLVLRNFMTVTSGDRNSVIISSREID